MLQDLSLATEVSSQPDCVLLTPRLAFMIAMNKLNISGERICNFLEVKELLNIAGFSQNGRNRILHLSSVEISELCKISPADKELWRSYVSELQTLLSKMDQARNIDYSFGRPFVTAELSNTTCKLARLRYLDEKGYSYVQDSQLRDLLLYVDWCKSLSRLIGIGQLVDQLSCRSIKIKSAIQLLELYRDDLIKPPRLRIKQNFDAFELHYIEIGDFRWMDDGGESYLEAIRDMPLSTQYDDLPHFDSVLDWFIATKPVLDKNQIKRGWECLEKLSEEWHQHENAYGLYEEYIDEYPSWSCAVSERQDEWLSAIPTNNVYKLVPLTTPRQLLEESISMHHCVVTYLDDCISGNVRIFSIRACANNERIATAELTNRSGLWKVAQLKGKHNRELIQRTEYSDDPLAIHLDVLVQWYNKIAGGEK